MNLRAGTMLERATVVNCDAPILAARHVRMSRPTESAARAGMGILSFARSRPRSPLRCSRGAGRSADFWRASFVGFTE